MNEADAERAADALAPLGDGDRPDIDGAHVTLAVTRRTGAIAAAVRSLDATGIDVEDLALRRPTLDDVFLALTGKHVEEESAGDEEEVVA